MKLIRNLSWCVILAVSLFFTGCSKKDNSNNPTGSNSYTAPSIATDTLIKIPTQMENKASSDANLALGVAEIDMVNTFSTDLAGAFIYDQSTIDGWASSKNSDGSVTYSWKVAQFAYKITVYSSNSESWWKYEVDSASYTYPYAYIDDKGTSGETDWYYKDFYSSKTQYTSFKDTWTKNNGTNNATFLIYADASNTVESKFVSVSNSDKSGTLDIYELNDSNQLYHSWSYVWDKNGSGSYTSYDTDGTTILFTGTF